MNRGLERCPGNDRRSERHDAIADGIECARRTLRGVWVSGQPVVLRGRETYAYRAHLAVTFVLDDR